MQLTTLVLPRLSILLWIILFWKWNTGTTFWHCHSFLWLACKIQITWCVWLPVLHLFAVCGFLALLVLGRMMAFTMRMSCRPKVQTSCQNIPIHHGCLNRYARILDEVRYFNKISQTANANNYDAMPYTSSSASQESPGLWTFTFSPVQGRKVQRGVCVCVCVCVCVGGGG